MTYFRSTRFCFLLVAFVLSIFWGHLSLASSHRFLVGVNNLNSIENFANWASRFDLQLVRCFQSSRICIVRKESSKEIDFKRFSEHPLIRYVEADVRLFQQRQMQLRLPVDATGTNDCTDLWELDSISMRNAWNEVQGANAPIVAVQDSGFRQDHEEYSDRINSQWDYGDGDAIAEPSQEVAIVDHGSFVSAIIAANGDNGVGRVGILPHGQLNLQKIADSAGNFYISYHVAALDRLAKGDLGVRVVNYSVGGSQYFQSQRDAIAGLSQADILFVTSAGNCSVANCSDANNDEYSFYPGSYGLDHVISVAGVLKNDALNSYSHYGKTSVDLAAPGVNLCSAGQQSSSNYYIAGGTSYATPIVSGIAALVMESHPLLSAVEVARVLRASARKVSTLDGLIRSGGIVNAERAIYTALPRMNYPQLDTINGRLQSDMTIENLGAKGNACLVITHSDALSFVAASMDDQCLERKSSKDGDIIELADAGKVEVSDKNITVFCIDLVAHSTNTIQLEIHGKQTGYSDVGMRVVMSSQGANYLNAPYRSGTKDTTGFDATFKSWTINNILANNAAIELHACKAQNVDAGVDLMNNDAGANDASGDELILSDTLKNDNAFEDSGIQNAKSTGCSIHTSDSSVWLLFVCLFVRRFALLKEK